MSESCGKCVPCRVGTAHMYDLLSLIADGKVSSEDQAQREDLCDKVKHTILCGLGQAAPNAILSTLRYFRNEYLEKSIDRETVMT